MSKILPSLLAALPLFLILPSHVHGLAIVLQDGPPDSWEPSCIALNMQPVTGALISKRTYFHSFGSSTHAEYPVSSGGSAIASDCVFLNASNEAIFQVSADLRIRKDMSVLSAESLVFFHTEQSLQVAISGTATGPSDTDTGHFGAFLFAFNPTWNSGIDGTNSTSAWASFGNLPSNNSVTITPGNYWLYTSFTLADFSTGQDGTVWGVVGDANADANGCISVRLTSVPDVPSTVSMLGIALSMLALLRGRRLFG